MKNLWILILLLLTLKVFATPIDITSADQLEEVLRQEGKLIMLEVYADWCRACRMLSPILNRISEETQEKNFQIYRINVDRNRQIASALGVRSIPDVFIVRNGEPLHRMTGLYSRDEYLRVIREFY